MCVKKTCSYFSKLCKSFLIYHSRSLFAQYVWMTIFLFLLALGKCITLMGSKTNVVCCSVPYITLIIGKWSLVHKKQKTLPFENSIHVERNWYHMHAIIMIHRKVLIIIIHKNSVVSKPWKMCMKIKVGPPCLWTCMFRIVYH